jgi:hypothetical protein
MSWRANLRDPRVLGISAIGGAGGFTGGTLGAGSLLWAFLLGGVLALLLYLTVPFSLAPWRDARSSPRFAANAFLITALCLLGVGLLSLGMGWHA